MINVIKCMDGKNDNNTKCDVKNEGWTFDYACKS